jgi:LAS superfamily LD-carboxypeptidase LdcB
MSYLLNYKNWRRVDEATIAVNQLNGNMQDNMLTKISVEPGDAQGVHKLNPEAAADYERMRAAAKADGVVWGITDSYRTYAVQDKIFDWEKFNRTGQKKKKGTDIAAAYPGTSNHGYGSAVDINLYGPGISGASRNSQQAKANYELIYNWLKANANNYGFFELKGEPWHWDHKASAQKYAKGGATLMVPSQVVTVSNLVREKNPLLAQKLERFERGDLIITPQTKGVEDIVSFIKAYLPEQYKKELGEEELASGEFSAALLTVLQKFQKEKNLPNTSGELDAMTYNEIFKDVVVQPASPGEREITKVNDCVIAKGSKSSEFALVYGGNPSTEWGAEKMFKLVDGILAAKGKNVIYSNNENSIEVVEKTLKSKYPDAEIVSVSGFSGGGPKTLAALQSGKYRFIGLIDPYLDKPIGKLPQTAKIMFNPSNWGGGSFDKVKEIMTAMASKADQSVTGGIVPEKHGEIPAKFFTQYGNLV